MKLERFYTPGTSVSKYDYYKKGRILLYNKTNTTSINKTLYFRN